jgi:hypothetical protein
MARKQMKLGGLFVFFLIVVAAIPFLYSYFGGKGKFYSAFTDMATGPVDGRAEVTIPATLPKESSIGFYNSALSTCRGVYGQPCSEGSFCDGATNSCQPRYA